MLLVCQAIFGVDRGAELVAVLEQSTGEPCPCKQGLVCPLMPADDAVVPLPTPVEVPGPRREWLRGLEALAAASATVFMGYGVAVLDATTRFLA